MAFCRASSSCLGSALDACSELLWGSLSMKVSASSGRINGRNASNSRKTLPKLIDWRTGLKSTWWPGVKGFLGSAWSWQSLSSVRCCQSTYWYELAIDLRSLRKSGNMRISVFFIRSIQWSFVYLGHHTVSFCWVLTNTMMLLKTKISLCICVCMCVHMYIAVIFCGRAIRRFSRWRKPHHNTAVQQSALQVSVIWSWAASSSWPQTCSISAAVAHQSHIFQSISMH